eukprot:s2196_g7.t1
MCAISRACIELCDPDNSKARDACGELLSTLAASRDFGTTFEHVLAPVVFRLAERPPQWRLLEDVCSLLQLLLERVGPDALPERKAANVFPLLCERVCGLLETVLSAGRSGGIEVVAVQLLRILKILLEKWSTHSARRSDISKMQTGFIAHLAVSLLSEEASREEQLLSAEVLQTLAEVESVDTLASFYPGVCTALAKVLLKRSHGQIGSRMVVASCSCFSAWLQAVLTNEINHHLLSSHPAFEAFELVSSSISEGLAQIFSLQSARCAQSLPSNTGAQLPGLGLARDETWLDETSSRTSQVLVAILRGEHSTATLWAEKASVRQAFLNLSMNAVRRCNRTLKEDALEACFENVFASLSDAMPAKTAAHAFLQESMLFQSQGQLVQSRLEEWLIKLFQELVPGPNREVADGALVPKRLARLDGLLQFLESVSGGGFHWTNSCIERLRGPILRACSVNAGELRQLLEDQRSLASMPGTAESRAEKFVQLFPYDVRDADQRYLSLEREDASTHHLHHLDVEVGEHFEHVTSDLPKESVQVKMWILRALYLADGREDLANGVRSMLGRLTRVIGAETLFTSIFEESNRPLGAVADDWQERGDALASETETQDSAVQRRTAAMVALAAFLDLQSAEQLEHGPPLVRSDAAKSLIPLWLVNHCLGIAISAREANMPPASPTNELVLHVLAAHLLMTSALRALARQDGRQVHRQVRHLLKPLLEDLGTRSFAISLASRGTLVLLYRLLVSKLLEEYADYLVGDICFQLRFEISEIERMEDCRHAKLPLLLDAVVQHASLEMIPFLADVVHTLMTGAFAKCKGSTGKGSTGKPAWILRCLAGIVQRLALVVCHNRLKRSEQGTKLPEPRAKCDQSESSAVAAFLSGGQQTWTSARRRDGFLLDDLGHFLDEDAYLENKEEIESGAVHLDRSEPSEQLQSMQRRIASSIVMWARHDLQSAIPMSRHLAHVAVVHGLTVLSTKVRDLLPHVHDIWQQLVPSFSQEVPTAAQADACILLKHVARLSGDFIRRRFMDDCWDSLWLRLRSANPVTQASASPGCSEFKMQCAALDVLAFLSGDSSLVQNISKHLLALAIKFLSPRVADRLKGIAWALVEQMVVVDPDLAWLFVQELRNPKPRSADWSGILLLDEVGATELLDEDTERLRGLVSQEDNKPWCPRVGLGAGGELWLSFMAGNSQTECCEPDARSDSEQCFYISDSELKFLQANVPRPKPKSGKDEGKDGSEKPGILGMPLGVALHPSLWAIFFAHIAFNYGVYYLTNWSPTYYSDVLGLKPEEAKYHLMAPYIMSLITTCLSPMLVKAVGKLGWDLLTMRRVFTAAGFISAGVALAPVHQLRGYNPWISTMLFSAANVFYGLTPNGFKANYLEITEQYIGVVSGYGNTLGTVASWVGPQFVAFLLQRFESWDNVMLSLAIMNVMASVNYIRSASVKPVEKLIESKKEDTKKID